jgi:hypothetical protein
MGATNLGTLPLGAIILGNEDTSSPPTGGPPAGVLGATSLIDGYRCKQGDTAVAFEDALVYSDGAPADLTGTQVALGVRSLATSAPLILSGVGSVVIPTSDGRVTYTPSASDTSSAGDFTACWIVAFPNGTTMTFPSVGYIDVTIEPALSSLPQMLVDLETVKSYPGVNIAANDHRLDDRLIGFIEAARPLIEQITGPIIPTVYDEKYAGGNNTISLSHRAAVGYGTTPILNVMAVSEYVGPTEYPLANVADAALGSIYSFEVNERYGTITRRTSGGGTIAFPAGPNSVHVVYQAGQGVVPANVQEATLELVRMNYETTMAVGAGRRTQSDLDQPGPPLGFFMSRRVHELLSPTRRFPAIA